MPLIMMIRRVLFCLSILISSHSFARGLSHTFTPSLFIPNSEQSIKIETEETFFSTRFLPEDEKLADINMPFKVVSTYSQPFFYALHQYSKHECSMIDDKGEILIEEFNDIEVKLTEPNAADWSNNIEIKADSVNEHVMTLTFPKTPPSGRLKNCSGFVSIQLELAANI